MHKWPLLFSFLLLTCFGTLRGQTIESLQFEIDNLRDQIIRVIEDNNRSLVVVDSELAVAKARIFELVKENESLKKRNLELAAPSSKGKPKKADELQVEVEELKQQLYSNRQTAQRNMQQSIIEMQVKDQQLLRLTRERDSLLEVSRQAEQRMFQLQVESESLWEQLASSNQSGGNAAAGKPGSSEDPQEVLFLVGQLEEARRMLEEAAVEREQAVLERDQLAALMDSLVKSNQMQLQKEQQQALVERHKMQAKLDSLTMFSLSKASPRPQAPVEYARKIDSLKHENKVLRESLVLAQKNQGVEESRLRAVELQEKELKDAETRLEIREHLVKNRENDIAIRQHELEIKEEKYKNLDEKEKRLKLIEQRLNELLNGQSRGSN